MDGRKGKTAARMPAATVADASTISLLNRLRPVRASASGER